MGLERAPVFHGHAHGKTMLNLAQVNEISEIHGEAKIAEQGLGDAGIAALVALVVLHHR